MKAEVSYLFRCQLTPYSAHQAYEPHFPECNGNSEKLGLPWPPFSPRIPGQFEESSYVKKEIISSLVSVQLKFPHVCGIINSIVSILFLMLSLVF